LTHARSPKGRPPSSECPVHKIQRSAISHRSDVSCVGSKHEIVPTTRFDGCRACRDARHHTHVMTAPTVAASSDGFANGTWAVYDDTFSARSKMSFATAVILVNPGNIATLEVFAFGGGGTSDKNANEVAVARESTEPVPEPRCIARRAQTRRGARRERDAAPRGARAPATRPDGRRFACRRMGRASEVCCRRTECRRRRGGPFVRHQAGYLFAQRRLNENRPKMLKSIWHKQLRDAFWVN
jgi:hypothetical protein